MSSDHRINQWAKGCLQKVRYRTLEYADQAAQTMARRFGVSYQIYWCRHCAGYHLTTSKNKVRQESLNQVGQ